jgi:hypothetical protein
MRKHHWLAVTAVLGAFGSLASEAQANQIFHTTHAGLHSVVGAPLRGGFVNDIHMSGAVNAAHEEYSLNGAEPSTSYQVALVGYASTTCAGSPFLGLSTALFATNGSGNGNADFTFPQNSPPPPPHTVSGAVGVIWQFLDSNGDPVYETDCVVVTF